MMHGWRYGHFRLLMVLGSGVVASALLDREVLPMHTDWLGAVMAERNGGQLVAMIEAKLIDPIGCVPSRYCRGCRV